MNNFEQITSDKIEQFKLVGSQVRFTMNNRKNNVNKFQVNLTSRSDHSPSFRSFANRPRSAVISCQAHFEQPGLRPKSAGSLNGNHSKCRSRSQLTCSFSESKVDEKSSISVSSYTDSSSRLLQNLLNNPSDNVSKHNSFKSSQQEPHGSEDNAKLSGPESSSSCLTTDLNPLINYSNIVNAMKDGCSGLKIQSWAPEEKTVRFLEHHRHWGDERRFERNHRCYRCGTVKRRHIPSCCMKRLEQRCASPLHGNDTEIQFHPLSSEEERPNSSEPECKNFEKHSSHSPMDQQPRTSYPVPFAELGSSKPTFSMETCNRQPSVNLIEFSPDPKTEQSPQKEEEKIENECPKSNSTYDEIVRLLQTLDEEDSESLNLESKKDSGADSPSSLDSAEGKIDHLDAVYSYLEEVEKGDEFSKKEAEGAGNTFKKSSSFQSPRLEELLNKNSVELAHEVLSLKIQIEDQKKGIKLLRDTLTEIKEAQKTTELEHQEALHKASAEAEALVQRHQKFIKQLLNEKKNLNDTVSKLVEDLKAGEEKHKKNMKAVEEKHLVEIKRAKEAQAVADKIKREKWMETKTQKIKEMTVKGLEPELSRMAAHQQEEMVELRNLHRAELEAVELRAARRTSELMDQLRAELTKEKQHAIARETAVTRTEMEKDFEDERNKLKNQCQMLKDRIKREEAKLVNQEMESQQKLLEFKREVEKENQRMARDHQEKLEEVQRRHLLELKNLRESLEAEKEIWINNYKKQQAAKVFERETELHQQYKRERDREIEVIIEALEKESTQAQMELNQAAENKLKRLKEKLEAEIKEVEASEAILKTKLSESKALILEKEDFIIGLNTQIRQLQAEMAFLRKTCEEMTSERSNLKEIIRKEYENSINDLIKEKENLEREISFQNETHLKELAKKDQINVHAKNEMQKELTRVYSRIKTAVNKKEKVIESLREENRAANQRSEQLEMMLDRQRRNLLLQ